MSRVWFAVTPSWTTLRMRQAVICRSRGGFSANEKEDMFASNDNWLLLTCQGSGLGILYPLTLSFVRRGIPFAETIVWRLTLLIIVLYQNIFVSSPCINNIFGPSRSESHLCRYPVGFSLLPRSLLIQKHVTFLKTLHGRRQDNTMSTLGVSQCYISPPPPLLLWKVLATPLHMSDCSCSELFVKRTKTATTTTTTMTTELLMNYFFKRLAFTIEMRAFSAKMSPCFANFTPIFLN